MAWVDRLREPAYTSPSGVRTVFIYEDVSTAITKKTAGFEFPDADGVYVQDNGRSGRRFPLRVIFSGADYDRQAAEFDASLLERGVGTLDHPIYGTFKVVPFGEIKRRDDLKTAANQAIFEVVFWETIGVIYPTSQNDPATGIITAVGEFNDEAANEFDDAVQLETASETAEFKEDNQSFLDSVSEGLDAIADVQANVARQFNAINDSINSAINTLIARPLALASQTLQLIQSPARALASIQARLDAYGNLAQSILSGGVVEPGQDNAPANRFRTADLHALGYISGSVLSVVNTGVDIGGATTTTITPGAGEGVSGTAANGAGVKFRTKTEALGAADLILAQFEAVVDWRDSSVQSLDVVDVGGAYSRLQEAVALVAGYLVEISFELRQERSLILDRDRTIIDLCGELYGSVDNERLDFLIESNDLSGSEILELPRGKRIAYYI